MCSPCPTLFFQLGGDMGAGSSRAGPDWGFLSHLPPPHSRFLCKKWKKLHVGDLVCLHKDNIIPVSCCQPGQNSLLLGEVCLLTCFPPASPPCCSFPPTTPPHPRLTCSCWPARSPTACATWRQLTSMGEAWVSTRGLGAGHHRGLPQQPQNVAPQALLHI